MAGIGFGISRGGFKRTFFDRTTVTRAADHATRGVLSKFGAYVRTRSRHSLRKRKRTARPGEPPSSHAGGNHLLRNGIFFGYDANRQSVVIGPAALNQASPYGPVTVPELLEHGGTVTARRRGRLVTLTYEPHPYMGPAFKKELADQMPDLWKNSIRKVA